jgi:hypothetical protein
MIFGYFSYQTWKYQNIFNDLIIRFFNQYQRFFLIY